MLSIIAKSGVYSVSHEFGVNNSPVIEQQLLPWAHAVVNRRDMVKIKCVTRAQCQLSLYQELAIYRQPQLGSTRCRDLHTDRR